MNWGNFFGELKRRHVYRVAVVYAVVAWLLTQIATQVFPFFEIPDWGIRLVVLAIVIGFPVALILAWAFELTPEGIKRAEDVDLTKNSAGRNGRTWIWITATAAILAAGLFVGGIFNLFHAKPNAAATANDDKSIAVLPLVNESGDQTQEYFSDGLSEELINGLGQIHELRVMGRNSSFHFKGKTDDSRAIGQALGVANLLEGSVRKDGDRVRINVELVDAADGSQRWSQTYDRDLKDIFATQEEIAKSVGDQLRVALLGTEAISLAHPSNGNLAAYNAYLNGQYLYEQFNLDSATKALSFLKEATRLDPRYAEAYALKARAWELIGIIREAEGKEAFENARRAATTALSLKPNLAMAHAALGYIYIFADWNLKAAEDEISLVHDKDSIVLRDLSIIRNIQWRAEEAVALNKEAISLDPVHAVLYSDLASSLISVGQLDQAKVAARKAVELQPPAATGHSTLSAIAILQKQPAVAMQEAELAPHGVIHDVAVTLAQQTRGDQPETDAAVKVLIEQHAADDPLGIAVVYAYRGEADKVFEWLDRAYELHEPRLIGNLRNPFLERYRSDPRFAALCNKIGLPVPH
jgi:serine/threonine-protein kinase